ncbi:peptidase M10 [Streptomyces sp. NPDC050418]|uniref:peptidase M10 n=1 Tax=Streptomyces sp. NPDC050418 TaxID=3365612 RepID=UPI003795B548
MTIADLPTGSDALDCEVVGRTVTYDGVGVAVPEPGEAVTVSALSVDGSDHGFTLQVAADGTISYELPGSVVDVDVSGADTLDSPRQPAYETSDLTHEGDSHNADAPDAPPEGETEVAEVDAAVAPGACSDGTYKTLDLKEYGTYNWYVGDGGMPGALSRSAASVAFRDAVGNIVGMYNNCGLTDTVTAQASYKGFTDYEADISSSGTCKGRDGLSTWDAGDLPSNNFAISCSWSYVYEGKKNDLREGDVRYNTTDHDFTDSPTSSCYRKVDVRGLGTHEAGHVFGLADLYGDDDNLTMYGISTYCTTKARTLGLGDVRGLRSIY